jgi:hypothetical protein
MVDEVDFYEFSKDFNEYLYSLGFISLTSDSQTNYFYGKDYKEYFCLNHDYHSIWYRETNYSKWYKIDLFTSLNVSFLKQIASNLVKVEKQNNIKKAIEEIEKDFK